MIVVTGGAGFIGANFVADWLAAEREPVHVIDKLTYAGSLDNLEPARTQPGFGFDRIDVCDGAAVLQLLRARRPRAVLHFAAESHVDRSIVEAGEFVRTNVYGTFGLLDAALTYWRELAGAKQRAFRFLHVSTDEVYGSLGNDQPPFTEASAYAPNNPYAASKAGADHLVRAYRHTHGLPTLTTHCSNNYGPLQFPEKLIPRVILDGIAGRPLRLYGDGLHVRDWLYVADHCRAIRAVLAAGRPGEVYNIGSRTPLRNLDVVHAVCDLLDELRPCAAGPRRGLVSFVPDRPGHDRRYGIDPAKLERELGWRPAETFVSGLRHTVQWYLQSTCWVDRACRRGEATPARPPAA